MGVEIAPGDYNSFFRAFLDGIRAGEWAGKPKGIAALGIRPEDWLAYAAPGHVRYVWPNDGARDIQPGRVFGGWVAALSDHVVSICMFSALKEGEGFTTQDLQVKLFRPVGGEKITIEAKLVNRSRTTGYVEAEWRGDNGKLLAKVLAWKAIRDQAALASRG